jgi:MFS family permease
MPQPHVSAATPNGMLVLPVLGLLMAFASISTDFYLPALPEMAQSLHATPGAAEFSISSYLIGFSLGQLFWGPVGDRYGRGAAVAGMILAVDAWTDWGGLAGLAIPLFFYVSVMGFIIANAISGALAMFPERTGAVSALVGSIQYGGGIVGSALIGVFADDAPSSIGLVIAVCAICGMLCTLRLLTSPKTINSSLLNKNGRH